MSAWTCNWSLLGGWVVQVGGRENNSFYRTQLFFPKERESDAKLAAAAPDLLAALQALMPDVDEEIDQRKFSGNDEDWAALQELSTAAHAAIAKATTP